MRSRFLPVVAVAAVSIGLAAAPAAAASAIPREQSTDTYYVALGDSLAGGYQPDTNKDEPISYTDNLYQTLSASDPNLKFVRIGCDGETTVTMIDGGKCSYPDAASQLDFAVKFMTAHPGQIKYVTLDIGSNDVYHCVSEGDLPDIGCITQSLPTVSTNTAKITDQLHRAGGDGARYVGMNYFNPALAEWTKGGATAVAAQATAVANNLLSATIVTANTANGFKTADVLNAFSNNDIGNPVDVPGFGSLPRNVAQICLWTWMCTPYHDIHATPTGHRVIADTFLPLLTTDAPGASLGPIGL